MTISVLPAKVVTAARASSANSISASLRRIGLLLFIGLMVQPSLAAPMDLKSTWEKVSDAVVDVVSSAADEVAEVVDAVRPKPPEPLKILDISERNYEGRNSIAIMLSAPVDASENFQQYLNVTNVVEGIEKEGKSAKGFTRRTLVEGAWLLSKNRRTLWFSHTEPDQRYQVTVYKGLSAEHGGELAENKEAELYTRNLERSVNFDSKGAFLTSGMGKGLPVVTVNVPEVNIDFFRINADQQHTFLERVSSNRSVWWSTEYLSQTATLVYSGRFDLEAEHNRQTKRSIDVEGIAELAPPGIYMAVMLVPGEYSKKQVTWFAVTDIGLHARHYQGQLDVYSASLKQGTALGGVKLSLLDNDGKVLDEKRSSPEGLVSFSRGLDKARLVVAEKSGSYSLIEIKRPALDLSAFDLGQRPFRAKELFVYGPRDLYRPGEVAHFSALIRNYDGKLTKSGVLQAEIRRPDGSVFRKFAWAPTEQGYYEKQWQISDSAATGQWELVVGGPGLAGIAAGNESAGKRNASSQGKVVFPFKVEEFLPERMKLTLASEKLFSPKQTIEIKVQGDYLYGAPAGGNRLSTNVSTTPLREAVPSLKDYVFGDVKAEGLKHRFELEDTKLDKNGSYTLSIPSRWQDIKAPITLNATSSLYESGGRPVSRLHGVSIWPEVSLPGIRPSFKNNNPESNSTVSVDLVIADQTGNKLASDDVQIKLVREDRNYFWVYSEHRGWHYEWTDKEFAELTDTVKISEGESTKYEFPVDWGSYRLEVLDTNTGALSSLRFYAGYNWYERWQRNQQGSGGARPDEVSLAFDKQSYRAGDIARLSIQAPEAGEALILVESDKPLYTARQTIPAGGGVVEIPVKDTWDSHNIYASVVVLKPASEKESITPKRSMGLIHLPLDRTARELAVSIEAPEKVLPNKTTTVEVAVASADGEPAKQAMITLAAVDVGILNITDFETPDPHDFFFGQRRYSVDSRDMYNKLLPISSAQRAKLRFGGDADLSRGGKKPQSDVQIVSLFSGLVKLNEQGKAILPLELPDFDGRLRLMAVAFDAEDYGAQEKEMTVAAPVISQISMPRFLAYGDTSSLALDVTNLSGGELSLTAVLSTDTQGITIASKESKQTNEAPIVLADGERTTLRYSIQSEKHSGAANIKLALSAEGIETVNKQWRLGLRPAYPATTKKAFKTLSQNEGIVVDNIDIQGLIPETVVAAISASNKVDLNLAGQLENLLQYPYGCLEQTASRIFPLIYATPARQQAIGLTPLTADKRVDMVQKGFDKLASKQLDSYGFGLWSNHSSEEHYLTAYVADTLISAREMGFAVPEELLENTLARLREYIRGRSYIYVDRWSENRQAYEFAYQSYAAFVLARANKAALGDLRRLYARNIRFEHEPLAFFHLGLALKLAGDQNRAASALKVAVNANRSDKYIGDYGSAIRDKAMMIYLMLQYNSKAEQALPFANELATMLRDKKWLSTQERNAVFLAGVKLAEAGDESWQAVFRQGAEHSQIDASGLWRKTLSGADISQGLSLLSKSEKPLLSSVIINGYGKQPPESVNDKGLAVERFWYNENGEQVSPSEMKVGDLYLVQVRISAEQRVADGLLVELLPAGLELENQNLEHAIKIDDWTIKTNDGKRRVSRLNTANVVHQEFRDDRYVAAVDIRPRQTSDVFYLVRAVTPGEYIVPPSQLEDMYKPERRAIGESIGTVRVSE